MPKSIIEIKDDMINHFLSMSHDELQSVYNEYAEKDGYIFQPFIEFEVEINPSSMVNLDEFSLNDPNGQALITKQEAA